MYDLYAVGDFGPADQWNPAHVIREKESWPLLARMSKGPVPLSAIPEHLRAALEPVGIMKRHDDTYRLGFAWFTTADQQLVAERSHEAAQTLAKALLKHQNRIDGLLGRLRCRSWVDLPDLRFALVGCFGLDWGGLDALKRSGHLIHEKEQPGDRRYVMYVLEPVESLNQKDYAGSHSAEVSQRFTWTSFGDHSGRRLGLPDLVWRLYSQIQKDETLPTERRQHFANAILESSYGQMETAAEDLVAIVEGGTPEGSGQALLEASGALRDGRPTIPVLFTQTEAPIIGGVVSLVRETVLSVIEHQYHELADSLQDITPNRCGVPFGETFNMVWHEIFGQTNRILAEAGYLADPVPQLSGEGRYRWWLTVNS